MKVIPVELYDRLIWTMKQLCDACSDSSHNLEDEGFGEVTELANDLDCLRAELEERALNA